jgi:hypothetical protein
MNLQDRSFSLAAESAGRRAEAGRRRRHAILGIAVVILLAGLAVLYVWWTTLCGDCGSPPT